MKTFDKSTVVADGDKSCHNCKHSKVLDASIKKRLRTVVR